MWFATASILALEGMQADEYRCSYSIAWHGADRVAVEVPDFTNCFLTFLTVIVVPSLH